MLRMSNLDVGEAKGKDSASFFQELLYPQLSRGKIMVIFCGIYHDHKL